jgi:hypothetical protein
MRSSVVDPKRRGTSANFNAERFPREQGLEDALAEVTSEEQRIRPIAPSAARKRALATPRSCASSTTAKSYGRPPVRMLSAKPGEHFRVRDRPLRLQRPANFPEDRP